jgi:transcriptional regulator with XRE-family HTH domain
MGVIVSMIEEQLDRLSQRVTWSELAQKSGVSPGNISHFRNDEIELNFRSLLNISKFLYNDDYVHVMSKWCLNLRLPKNLKCALEFLSVNLKLDELENLIQTIEEQYDSRDLKNWVDIYKIMLKRQRNQGNIDFIEDLRRFSPKTIETKLLSMIMELYYFYSINDYKTMLEKSKDLIHAFTVIKDEFIRSSFEARLYEILAYTSLHNLADIDAVRKYATKIFSQKICAIFTLSSYYLMGMSFLFEDYDKCLYYLKEYEKLLRVYNFTSYLTSLHNQDIPFVNNVWGKTTNPEEINDISERAHYEAKYGDKKMAIELLDKLDETPFRLYYRGIAENDSTILLKSLIKFMKQGNKFYAKLPYDVLMKDEKMAEIAHLIYEN